MRWFRQFLLAGFYVAIGWFAHGFLLLEQWELLNRTRVKVEAANEARAEVVREYVKWIESTGVPVPPHSYESVIQEAAKRSTGQEAEIPYPELRFRLSRPR